MPEGASEGPRKEEHQGRFKIDIRIRTLAVFGIVLGVVFSLIAISDMTDRWDGTSVNSELITAACAAIIFAVLVAGLYYSTVGTEAPVVNKIEKAQIQ
jgi:hypothetical protein